MSVLDVEVEVAELDRDLDLQVGVGIGEEELLQDIVDVGSYSTSTYA